MKNGYYWVKGGQDKHWQIYEYQDGSWWIGEVMNYRDSDYFPIIGPYIPSPDELVIDCWMYQHEETGQIGYVDVWQVENSFFENNPRLQKIKPIYREKKDWEDN